MGKKSRSSILIPAAALALTFAATSSAVTVVPRAPLAFEKPSDFRLQALCHKYWGSVSEDGSYCRFEQVFHLNLAHVGNKTLLTRIPVFPGDTVSVAAVNAPQTIVGGTNYGPYSSRFISDSGGYLSFRSPKQLSLFSVQQVRVLRCFSAIHGALTTVSCPEQNQLKNRLRSST